MGNRAERNETAIMIGDFYFDAVYNVVTPKVSGVAAASLKPQAASISQNFFPWGKAITDSGR